ncbi:MAG TPA: SUMF1/EgtB/PvdO family nonheme iron enzyme [Nitrospirales bacterium]|nr:SUMF1/EgtB/PvdO family nonheme iron enzyme [Nitrospira sp.]HQU27542.1 SUMF1/EgtB/PvdO family nonheme iron enzyme [Nitrospirales bacterium]
MIGVVALSYYRVFTLCLAIWLLLVFPGFSWGELEPPPPMVDVHIANITSFTKASPSITIPKGWFLMGTNRRDDLRHTFETHYDDTEFPQRRIWVDGYEIDKYEVSLAEYLKFLLNTNRTVSQELRGLIWHLISVHFIPDQALAPWPALYVTWEEARDFCLHHKKRLPSEAEWEKAARGESARIFPWGEMDPTDDLAVFGQYHVHEIPLVATVDSFKDGQSIYKVLHLSGNIAEWVNDWLGSDYYPIMPEKNPPGPKMGRYKVVRGGSWKSKPVMLRSATRGGASPETRSATIGFRCVKPNL